MMILGRRVKIITTLIVIIVGIVTISYIYGNEQGFVRIIDKDIKNGIAIADDEIDWRKAYDDFSKKASMQPDNWDDNNKAGLMALEIGLYPEAKRFLEKI